MKGGYGVTEVPGSKRISNEADALSVCKAKESKKQKHRITLIGNNGVIKIYEGVLSIRNESKDMISFKDENGIHHNIYNQGGFIHVEYNVE